MAKKDQRRHHDGSHARYIGQQNQTEPIGLRSDPRCHGFDHGNTLRRMARERAAALRSEVLQEKNEREAALRRSPQSFAPPPSSPPNGTDAIQMLIVPFLGQS